MLRCGSRALTALDHCRGCRIAPYAAQEDDEQLWRRFFIKPYESSKKIVVTYVS